MSASIAKNDPRDLDPPLFARSAPAESTRRPRRFRRRTIVGSLAVVATAGVVAAPLNAVEDTRVRAAIVGSVEPVALNASIASERDLPVVVAAASRFDQSSQVVPVTVVDVTTAEPARTVWDDLADCESGNWDRNGNPIAGSARWDYGLTFSHGDIFEGGPNFHPRTWESFKDADMPGHAGQATREEQIAVAERVLAAQGWGAWPVCSRMLGLR